MKLYNGESPIEWFYSREMTADDMRADEALSLLFEQPCVLFDDGAGKVYSFATLESVAGRYGVDGSGEPEQVFAAIIEAANASQEQAPSAEERISDLEAALCELYESTL